MHVITQTTKPLLLAFALFSLTTLAACSPPWASKPIDFEFTGQVLSKATKEPIEGAYVLAVYEKVDLGIAGAARYCYKTKGMLTGKDGKFHFPIDKLDGNSPHMVHAIKPDYFLSDWELPTDEVWKAMGKEAFTNRHVYLTKQDVAKPSFQHGFRGCYNPESAVGIEAAIQFTNIVISEEIKYGRDGKNSAEGIELMQRAASRAEAKNLADKK
jgi:hypothetical protein